MMRKAIVVVGFAALAVALCFVGCGGPSCEDTKTCAPDGGDAASDVVSEPPVGCDVTKDPKDSPGGAHATTNGNVGNLGQDGTDGVSGAAQAILEIP